MHGRDRRGRSRPQRGYFHRIHHRQRAAIRSIRKHDQALNCRQTAHERVVRKVRVYLRRKKQSIERQQSRFDMESAFSRVDSEYSRRLCPTLPVEPEGMFDGGNALIKGEEPGDLLPGENQGTVDTQRSPPWESDYGSP